MNTQKNKNKSKKGLGQILIGGFLLSLALLLTAYNIYEANYANKMAQGIFSKLYSDLTKNAKLENYSMYNQMMAQNIDGIYYIGVLVIPSVGLNLPVAADWSYDQLRLSPCRYSGSYYEDNMVIAAHNYPEHFGLLQNIELNADVYFINANGHSFHYVTDNIEYLNPNQVENMIDGYSDLTLFTCDITGLSRYTVRCVKIKD